MTTAIHKRSFAVWGVAAMALAFAMAISTGSRTAHADPPQDAEAERSDEGVDDRRPPLAGPKAERRKAARSAAMDDDSDADEGRKSRRRDWRDGGGRDRGYGPTGEMDPPNRPRHRWNDAPPIPPEILDELREAVRVEMPELYEHMQSWRERHPEKFEQAMARFYPSLREYMLLRDREPALARTVIEEVKIEMRLRRLSREFREAGEVSPRRAELELELSTLTHRQVDIRMERRAARLRHLEERLRIERERLESDRARLDAIYSERLERVKRGEFDEPADHPRRRGPEFGSSDDDGDQPDRPRPPRMRPGRRPDGHEPEGRGMDGPRPEDETGAGPDDIRGPDDRAPRGRPRHHSPPPPEADE